MKSRFLGLMLLVSSAAIVSAAGSFFIPYTPAPSNILNSGGLTLKAQAFAADGWTPPGAEFPLVLAYTTGGNAVAGATVSVTLHSASVFVASTPAPTSGNGTAGSPLQYTIPLVPANSRGSIVIRVRARTLVEDPQVIWKDVSADVSMTVIGQSAVTGRTHGPKVTTMESARYGDRPFPVVMVQYQDIKHCEGAGDPYSECTGNHTSAALDEAVNSRTSGTSIWQLYQDLSFGYLHPIGGVSPVPNSPTTAFTQGYTHKFSTPAPNGTCTGTTLGGAYGTPLYGNRIEEGWYLLPGTQGYYGADRSGHALAGALTGQGLLFGIDDACGPTGKLAYDAASVADPDIDYNDYDTDKDGLVDFFNIVFVGDGGNGNTTPTGLNNVWPHSSSIEYYYTDANGETGYVSNDQFRNELDQPMYWVDAARDTMTTDNTGIPVYVRVGPYNVNPESAVDAVSVIGHEYGHSLGLPDFYSTGGRSTFGTWELMAADHFQFMTVYARQKMGWIVPRSLPNGSVTLRESKYDTGEIHWTTPAGAPYVLTGTGIHNADVYRLSLPRPILIDEVPSGTRAWYSGAGNDFGCPGHALDIFLPDLQQHASASAVTLKFKSLYEIEWDYDYGFVLVSEDGGDTWTSLASKKSTTIQNYNPNSNGCFTTYGNAITGVFEGGGNTQANPNRALGEYPASPGNGFIDDEFDLTAFKGKSIILRFAYSSDPGLAKRGWFIDDVEITAGTEVVYSSDFEESDERTRLFPEKWRRVSTVEGVDTDHAYFLELRDRISNDYDGKGQNDRGPISWEPGVSMIYADENHGYGNVGVDDPPAVTPVDSNPQPGNETPNLDDAAFTVARPFNGCTHVDNYTDPNGPGELWKLPDDLKFTVLGITGLSGDGSMPGSPAEATIFVELHPNCDLDIAAPVLTLDTATYAEPDTDGAYTLDWTRPAGAVGPETLQEATVCETLLTDDAEGGLGLWESTTEGTGAVAWQSSPTKVHSGVQSFWGRYTNGSDAQGVSRPASILTLKDPIAIPLEGESTLSYWDFHINEGDDSVVLEASIDDGATWSVISQSSRSALAPDAAPALATEPMSKHAFPLDAYRGESLKVRFRMQSGGEDRAGSAPLGWYVDDVAIETSNFEDVTTGTTLTHDVSGKADGTFCYRVRTLYPAGTATLAGPWSESVRATVDLPGANLPPLAKAGADFSVDEGGGVMLSGAASTDPEGGTLEYQWSQTGGPAVAMSNAGTAVASFTAPQVNADTPLSFVLTVTDAADQEATDTIVVTVRNVTAGGGGGGGTDEKLGDNKFGGSLPSLSLLVLGLLALGRRRIRG